MLPSEIERAEVGLLHAIGSITLPTGRMSIMEDPDKVAAFIDVDARAVSKVATIVIESVGPSGPVHRPLGRLDKHYT
jgi:hypothetical protein